MSLPPTAHNEPGHDLFRALSLVLDFLITSIYLKSEDKHKCKKIFERCNWIRGLKAGEKKWRIPPVNIFLLLKGKYEISQDVTRSFSLSISSKKRMILAPSISPKIPRAFQDLSCIQILEVQGVRQMWFVLSGSCDLPVPGSMCYCGWWSNVATMTSVPTSASLCNVTAALNINRWSLFSHPLNLEPVITMGTCLGWHEWQKMRIREEPGVLTMATRSAGWQPSWRGRTVYLSPAHITDQQNCKLSKWLLSANKFWNDLLCSQNWPSCPYLSIWLKVYSGHKTFL